MRNLKFSLLVCKVSLSEFRHWKLYITISLVCTISTSFVLEHLRPSVNRVVWLVVRILLTLCNHIQTFVSCNKQAWSIRDVTLLMVAKYWPDRVFGFCLNCSIVNRLFPRMCSVVASGMLEIYLRMYLWSHYASLPLVRLLSGWMWSWSQCFITMKFELGRTNGHPVFSSLAMNAWRKTLWPPATNDSKPPYALPWTWTSKDKQRQSWWMVLDWMQMELWSGGRQIYTYCGKKTCGFDAWWFLNGSWQLCII